MEVIKAGLLIAAALGSTWVAREATGTLFGIPAPQTLMQTEQPAAQPPAGGATTAPTPVPEMSREEMDAEFRRAQAEIAGGGKETELKEFRPTKPLPADLPVALPSDI